METTFRSALLAKHHEKCLQLIEVINKSEQRINYYRKHLNIFETQPPHKWWDFYPCGIPNREKLAHEYEISCRAYERLKSSYVNSVTKITYFAQK